MTSTIIRTVALLSVLIGASAVLSSPSNAITATIGQKKVTYDLHRQMEGATKLKTSEFAAAIVGNMHAHATV